VSVCVTDQCDCLEEERAEAEVPMKHEAAHDHFHFGNATARRKRRVVFDQQGGN
jgi:hypothetical protein